MGGKEPQTRHWSRRFALQAIYQWLLTDHSVDDLLAQYSTDENWGKVDKDHFVELLSAAITNTDELVSAIKKHTDIPTEQIDPVEKAILLFSTHEILNRHDIPIEVVISEAVKLCKKFGSIEGYKFVNGVLDKIAEIRT